MQAVPPTQGADAHQTEVDSLGILLSPATPHTGCPLLPQFWFMTSCLFTAVPKQLLLATNHHHRLEAEERCCYVF